MTLKRLFELVKPYEEDYNKKEFINGLMSSKKLMKQFETMTEEYAKEIEKEGAYFIINNVSWKRRRGTFEERINFGYIRDNKKRKEIPCISLYL